ncbi:hypothetical protein DID78_01125 [Candidatus Marinamargulisbacteria bacterium SCGC AG-343-D04]|nr:hypothetical protein DID78_01125 [Candidatus Marinamargulisbacteria bacterium SCGC AG-343-D04]
MVDLSTQFNLNQNKDVKKQIFQKADSDVSFKAELVSKLGHHSGSTVHAADESHKQSLMKAKRKKVSSKEQDDDEEESVIQTIKELKKKLRKIRELERRSLGL